MTSSSPCLPAAAAAHARWRAAAVAFGREHGIADLKAAIPAECFRRSVPRQLLGILVNLVASVPVWWALAVAPWWLVPPLWFLAGTCAWGWIVIAHECGHGSFSRSRRWNHFVGHLLMTPFLYPYHSWRLLHHHHHTNTNSLERDIDWRPLPPAVFRRLPWRPRLTYRLVRTVFWWTGTLHQLFTQAFHPAHPAITRPRDRRAMHFSQGVVLLWAALFFPLLIHLAGWGGVLRYWAGPWLVSYGWFSLVTLMHHTHPEVPFLDKREWSLAASNLCLTVYCRYPRWIEFLAHDVNVHIPHHVAPAIPYFHLRRAHAALKEAFPDQVREMRFSFRELWRRITRLHLHDRRRGYMSFREAAGR